MGEFVLSYERYLNTEKSSINEGWRTWMATFMMLLNLGIVPPKIQAAELQDKMEWVQSVAEDDIALAKFIAMLNSKGNLSPDMDKTEIQALLTRYNAKNQVSLSLTDLLNSADVQSYDDDGTTKYTWTMTSLSSGDISVSGSITKDKVKPASYMGGVSLVSDYGDFMTSEVEKEIHKALHNYEKITGVEIAILTIPTFGDEDPSDYAVQVFNRWGIGKKRGNNGILVVTSMGDRKWHITTGYGMEDIFTDARCRQFGERYLVPNFKKGNYEKGFQDLVQAMQNEFGDIPIERTKENAEKAAIERKEDLKNFFNNALIITGLLAMIGAIGYLIQVSIKKRRRLLEQIADIKVRIENFDKDIQLLIDKGDTIFDDDKILDELKKAGEALNAKKPKKPEMVQSLSNELDVIINQLNEIKNIERGIRQLHMEVQKYQFVSIENQPADLVKAITIAQAAFKVMNFDKIDVSVATHSKFVRMYEEALSFYGNYDSMRKRVSDIRFKTNQYEKAKADLLAKLDKARKTADVVREMGHETEVTIGENEIEALRGLIDNVSNIYMTDLRTAYQNLRTYDMQTAIINAELEKPVKKYNDIISAKKFVDGADKEIKSKMEQIRDYIHNGHLTDIDRRQALALVNEFNDRRGSTKNPSNDLYNDGWEEPGEEGTRMSEILLIAAALSALLAGLDKIINKGKSVLDQKERRRRKEEEDRRKKREEEEEAARRRRNSSSSYGGGSSSYGGGGGSFGGFGGGSSGGGGAGGGW